MLCISPKVWSALGSKSCSASPSSPASSSDSSPGDDDDQADFDYYADHDNDDWNDYGGNPDDHDYQEKKEDNIICALSQENFHLCLSFHGGCVHLLHLATTHL